MAILYVAAESQELSRFAEHLSNLRKLRWPIDYAAEGVLNGQRVILAANGAGPKLAAQAVEIALRAVSLADLSASKLEAVVSTGFCGALDPNLQAAHIVIADSLANDLASCSIPYAAPETFVIGRLLSHDSIVISATEKQRLREASAALAVEMEAAGVAARAAKAGLPFYCIRVVSDTANESFAFDLNRMRSHEGRIQRGKIAIYALTHPQLLPGLIRLKRRADQASRELGDFLASCRIQPDPNIHPEP